MPFNCRCACSVCTGSIWSTDSSEIESRDLSATRFIAVIALLEADGSRCQTTWRLSNDYAYIYRRSLREKCDIWTRLDCDFLPAGEPRVSVGSCPSLLVDRCPVQIGLEYPVNLCPNIDCRCCNVQSDKRANNLNCGIVCRRTPPQIAFEYSALIKPGA
jgi:hypothetical protein